MIRDLLDRAATAGPVAAARNTWRRLCAEALEDEVRTLRERARRLRNTMDEYESKFALIVEAEAADISDRAALLRMPVQRHRRPVSGR